MRQRRRVRGAVQRLWSGYVHLGAGLVFDLDLGQYTSDRVYIGAAKFVGDGSIQGYTGFLSEPYYRPGEHQADYRGYPKRSMQWTGVVEFSNAYLFIANIGRGRYQNWFDGPLFFWDSEATSRASHRYCQDLIHNAKSAPPQLLHSTLPFSCLLCQMFWCVSLTTAVQQNPGLWTQDAL